MFAAGNTGAKGLRTVSSPSTAKNAIAVASTLATPAIDVAGTAQFGRDVSLFPFVYKGPVVAGNPIHGA